MKKLALAAAFAAGMTSFAVHAQEAPTRLYPGDFASAQKAAETESKDVLKSAPKGRTAIQIERGMTAFVETEAKPDIAARFEAVEKTGPAIGSVEFAERGRIVVVPAVDAAKAAALGATGSKPELVATARGETKIIGGKRVKASGSYGAIIARYAAAYGVPVSLAHAVIRVESNYRINARGSAGEVGLMQIKPATARGLGYSGSVKGLYAPETNIKFGMKYLGMAHKLGGGSTCGTILKYNAGHGARRMNPVSAAYCTKVKRHLGGA